MQYTDYLEHYGIKGMKWGVRRTPEQLGYKVSPRHAGKKKKSDKKIQLTSGQKKAIAIGAAAAAAGLATYGAYKVGALSKLKNITKKGDDSIRKDRKVAYRNRRKLTDDELKKRVQRLNLEKEFKKLTEEDLKKGRLTAKGILEVAGTQTAKTVTAGAMLYAVKLGMTNNFNIKEAADYIAPKPKKK